MPLENQAFAQQKTQALHNKSATHADHSSHVLCSHAEELHILTLKHLCRSKQVAIPHQRILQTETRSVMLSERRTQCYNVTIDLLTV